MKKFVRFLLPAFIGCALFCACSSVPSDPQKLADYALEKFKKSDYDALMKCGTEEYAQKLSAEVQSLEALKKEAETNKKMKASLKFQEEFMQKIAEENFGEGEMVDMGDSHKQVTYRGEEGSIRVLLTKENETWKVEQVGL